MSDRLILLSLVLLLIVLVLLLVFLFRELGRLSEKVRTWEKNFQDLYHRLAALPPVEERVKELAQEVSAISRLLTGRASGKGGEQILGEVLSALPPEILLREVEMGSGRVEFALKLRNGRLVPFDSKFVEPHTPEEDLPSRLISRARELEKYLEDPRSAGFALAAVPDRAYQVARKMLARAALENRVLLVPYSQALSVALLVTTLAPRLQGREGPSRDLLHFLEDLEKGLLQQEKLLRQGLQKIARMLNLLLKHKETLSEKQDV